MASARRQGAPARLAGRRTAPRVSPRRPSGGADAKRVALVTGAARGIGAACVRALVRDGWAVVALDRGEDDPRLPYALGSAGDLRSLARGGAAASGGGAAAGAGSASGHGVEARGAGTSGRVEVVVGDAASEAVLAEAVALAERRFGGLDACVCAAGAIAGGVPLWELPAAQLEAVLEVDLHAPIAAARVAIPALLRRPEPRDGRFIAVASSAASRGLPMLAAYCAAKAGVVGLVRALAAELRGTGVTANAVSPGSTRTPLLDESARLYGLESAEAFAAQAPLERLLEPDEVAAFIAFLAGPGGQGANGAELVWDGGLSA